MQIYATSSLGGYYAVNQLSKEIRMAAQPLMSFRKYTFPMDMVGRNKGDVVLFNKNSNLASNGGSISETSTIPKTSYTVQQGSMTMTEYGVAVPYTYKLKTMAEIQIDDVMKRNLRNSMAKVLDSTAGAQFQASDYKATITNTATTTFGSAGAAVAAAGANMSDKNVRDIIDRMKILNIPKWDGRTYQAICSTNSIRGLYDFFEAKAQNTTMSNLRTGSIGEYYGCQYEEETNLLTNDKGTYYGEAIFFGDDAVAEGIVVGEEIRLNTPVDFGRDLALAWYFLGGFQIIWDYSTDSETRIIHVTST